MKKFILGTKEMMVEYFDEAGIAHPATLVTASLMTVLRAKTKESDGYFSVQVGYGSQKKQRITKPVLGIMKNFGPFKTLKEFRLQEASTMKIGDIVDASVFAKGDTVAVSGISKGKGFQGGVKRHGFAGGSRTHGQKHSEREPGSIGGGLRSRVPKGMRMAGRMGGDRITVKNLKVLEIDKDNNILVISGAIPGRRGTMLEIVSK